MSVDYPWLNWIWLIYLQQSNDYELYCYWVFGKLWLSHLDSLWFESKINHLICNGHANLIFDSQFVKYLCFRKLMKTKFIHIHLFKEKRLNTYRRCSVYHPLLPSIGPRCLDCHMYGTINCNNLLRDYFLDQYVTH